MNYAAQTDVPISRTRGHIEDLLTEHHADAIGILTETAPPRATVTFRIRGWGVRMRIPMPLAKDFKPSRRGGRRVQGQVTAEKWAEQAGRARWRALFLTIKAKLVSIETGVESFEQAFLPHLVLPGGATVYDSIGDKKLLPGGFRPSTGAPQLAEGEGGGE